MMNGLLKHGRHLPANKKHSLEVLVLRGHLLIERVVFRLVEEQFRKPKVFDLSRMPFAVVLRLAEALYGSEVLDWVLEDTKQLNTIRNSIAHQLTDDTLAPRIKRFVSRFESREKKIFAFVGNTVNEKLAYCVASLHSEFLKIGKEV